MCARVSRDSCFHIQACICALGCWVLLMLWQLLACYDWWKSTAGAPTCQSCWCGPHSRAPGFRRPHSLRVPEHPGRACRMCRWQPTAGGGQGPARLHGGCVSQTKADMSTGRQHRVAGCCQLYSLTTGSISSARRSARRLLSSCRVLIFLTCARAS